MGQWFKDWADERYVLDGYCKIDGKHSCYHHYKNDQRFGGFTSSSQDYVHYPMIIFKGSTYFKTFKAWVYVMEKDGVMGVWFRNSSKLGFEPFYAIHDPDLFEKMEKVLKALGAVKRVYGYFPVDESGEPGI